MQQSKLDAIVNKLIDNAHEGSRGFVLDLAAKPSQEKIHLLRGWIEGLEGAEGVDDETHEVMQALLRDLEVELHTSIAVKQELPPADEFVGLADRRQHVLAETAAMLQYAQRYGTAEKSLLLYNMKEATLILDETMERGQRELITLPFTRGDAFLAFREATRQTWAHKQLLKFLEQLAMYLYDPTVLIKMREFRLHQEVLHDSAIEETEKSIGIMVKTRAGDQTKASFPKSFKIHVPVLAQDELDEELWVTIEINLLVNMPDKPGEPATFSLFSPTMKALEQKRVQQEAGVLIDGLAGFAVLFGTAGYYAPRVGLAKWGAMVGE